MQHNSTRNPTQSVNSLSLSEFLPFPLLIFDRKLEATISKQPILVQISEGRRGRWFPVLEVLGGHLWISQIPLETTTPPTWKDNFKTSSFNDSLPSRTLLPFCFYLHVIDFQLTLYVSNFRNITHGLFGKFWNTLLETIFQVKYETMYNVTLGNENIVHNAFAVLLKQNVWLLLQRFAISLVLLKHLRWVKRNIQVIPYQIYNWNYNIDEIFS